MQIKYFKVGDLKPYKNNPRKNDEAVDAVANSIKEFGFKVPIIIDKNNEIIAGHTRLKAAKKLGLKEVPCIIADDLTDEQIKAFRLADNKVGENSEWDFNLLSGELFGLDLDMREFGFEITGFDVGELSDEFSLAEGDRHPTQTMSLTFSDDQVEIVKEAIRLMKQTEVYKQYENEFNKNSNGNALFLVVNEWLQQKI